MLALAWFIVGWMIGAIFGAFIGLKWAAWIIHSEPEWAERLIAAIKAKRG